MPTISDKLKYNYWIHTAETLRMAANEIFRLFEEKYDNASEKNTIWEDNNLISGLMQSYMLTIAFSVENLLKGFCIYNYQRSNDLDSIRSLKELEKQLWGSKGHDLIKIAGCANLSLSQNEAEMLKRIQVYSIWAGRYHIPKHEHEIKALVEGKFTFATYASDRKLIPQLFERIKDEIAQSSKNGS